MHIGLVSDLVYASWDATELGDGMLTSIVSKPKSRGTNVASSKVEGYRLTNKHWPDNAIPISRFVLLAHHLYINIPVHVCIFINIT